MESVSAGSTWASTRCRETLDRRESIGSLAIRPHGNPINALLLVEREGKCLTRATSDYPLIRPCPLATSTGGDRAAAPRPIY